MDRVAVAQLNFSGTSTKASFWSICPAHVTDTFWLSNDSANRDQKSLFATCQSHSSILSINLVNELQCHSVNVRANCASIILFTTTSCHKHWSTCSSRACVGTPDGRGHSWPLSAAGKVYRKLRLTMVRAMRFYTLVPRFLADPPIYSATIRWGLPRARRRRFLSVRRVRQKVLASAGGFWSCYSRFFTYYLSCGAHVTIPPAISPCPGNLGTGTRDWCLAFWDVCHLPSDLVPACFPFAFDPFHYEQESFFYVDLHATPCCELLHHV